MRQRHEAWIGGRYAGLSRRQRIAASLPVLLVLAILWAGLLAMGGGGRTSLRANDPVLHLFIVRPSPPPRKPPPRPARAGGASARRARVAARPDVVSPIVTVHQGPTLELAPLAPLGTTPREITGLADDGLGSGSGAGAGEGQGSGTGDGVRGTRYAHAAWVRRPDQQAFRRAWPKGAAQLRQPAIVLLGCPVDAQLRPHDCRILWSNQPDPAYGRAAVAMMADALIRPVLRDGSTTDLPVIVPVTFVP